ncbi:MAG: acyl-CoA dehydrogenase [Micromonosporaceae bacterium]|nr:acyl-CoA dehydrogenase [Micromonosporaceae bacterium]
MRFALSSEQEQFGATVDALLTEADTPRAARAWAAGDHGPGLALWRRLADVGVTGLTAPEAYDGLGAGLVEVTVAFEQLGRHAVPGPLVESLVVVPTLLAGAQAAGSGAADSGLAGRWLAGIAAGKTLASLVLPPHVPYALDADLADPVLVVDGDSLRSGHVGRPLTSVDPARRLFVVTAAQPLATNVGAARGLDAGALACAAQLVGAGRSLLDTTVAYARQRRQFGRPIGAFQAVKHQLADVLVGLEMARPLVYGAAVALASDSATAARDISAAKVAAGDAAYRAARVALQVHGAIGYTAEHDLSLWLTKVRALVSAWGTSRWHRTRVREALCAAG